MLRLKKIKSLYSSVKKNNRSICLVLLICLISSGFFYYDSLRDAKGLTQLGGGVRTCLNRVGQGYTANLLGNTKYGAKYQATTERCFGDVGILVEDVYDNVLIMGYLNTLTTEVHWFHEKLSIGSSNLNLDFEKIENLALDIIEKINKKIRFTEWLTDQLEYVVLSISLLIVLMALWGWEHERRLRKNNLRREEEAFKILHNKERLKENNIDLVREVLKLNGFNNCLRLINYLKLKKEKDEIPVTVETKGEKKAINPSELTNMSLILSNMLDSFSSYFFKNGILIDLDEIEDIWIKGNEEVLEQIIFSMINYSIKKDKVGPGGKKIKIKLKKKDGDALLEISDIKLIASEEVKQNKQNIPVEMIICRELIKEFDGEISFEDIVEQNQIKGSKVGIILKGIRIAPPVNTKRVVALKKGKKKDILKEISNV